ncbi:unnamed protein product [Onchocerca ochengi]|uniref:RT_RNaseH_2 domain-containing protein n=1 Tax=Onchocerca ochengi TaxID=42157 RepID=A0A182EN02_ONCOC|nr:unnamed protein product [Onchocerca ochengi]
MNQIEQTWKLEAIEIKDLMTEYHDGKALEAFQKMLTIDSERRYVVGWPWKNQAIMPAKDMEWHKDEARQGRYLVMTDVKKAFLQVSLKREERDVTSNIAFSIAAVIRHLLNEGSSKLSTEIPKNLYVDNVVLTSENESEKVSQMEPQEYSEIQYSVFVDASENAMGLAVYARRSNTSIPRLEFSPDEKLKWKRHTYGQIALVFCTGCYDVMAHHGVGIERKLA